VQLLIDKGDKLGGSLLVAVRQLVEQGRYICGRGLHVGLRSLTQGKINELYPGSDLSGEFLRRNVHFSSETSRKQLKEANMTFKRLTARALAGVIFSVLAFVPNNFVRLIPVAFAEEGTPAAEVVWQHVGRIYLNPNTGHAVYAGYVVHINGITSSLFNGSPSEATAYFTFSTDVLTLTPMPNNGNVALSLVSAGTFSVYYNTSPNGDWNNPATFSSGQLIATFARKQSLFPEIGPIGFHSLSESLLSSQSFTFDGQTFNFNRIAPHGITFAQFFSTTPLTGIPDYPVAFAGAGTTIAVAGSPH
jgi:hypothetical protein